MFRSSWIPWSLLTVFVCAVGCGEAGSSLGTVKAGGVVTLDGQPLPGAAVSFSPNDAEGRAAVGTTDMNGKFTLMTMAPGDGALPGSYAVTVTKNVTGEATTMEDPRHSGGKMTPEQQQSMMEAMSGKVAKVTSGLPQKYASKDTSGFTATVTKGEANQFTFAMTSN